MAPRISRKLRMLRDARAVTEAEYEELLRLSRRKQTRKQKAAAQRNLRRACKAICKKKPTRPVSKTEHEVRKLRAEISEQTRQELLKAELKELKAKKREMKDAKRALRNLDFSIL